MGLRLFVAVSLEPDTRQRLAHAVDRAKVDSPAGLRWVAQDRWHFTLQFLGDTTEDRRGPLERALSSVATHHAPFELVLSGAGAFPNERKARVVWVGATAGADALGRLAADIARETAALGFEAEDRPFHAHLTIARLRRPGPVTHVIAALHPPDLVQPVHDLVLYRSHLAQSGARYEVLTRIPLTG